MRIQRTQAMPSIQPATEVNTLYNELVKLPLTDIERLGQIEWKLTGIHRRSPSLTDASVALLDAKCLLGKVNEARALAIDISPQIGQMDGDVFCTYLYALTSIGCFSECLEYGLDKLDATPQSHLNSWGNIVESALGTGDLTLALNISKKINVIGVDSLKYFSETTAGKMFQKYQNSILKIMDGQFSQFTIYFDRNDETPSLVTNFFVPKGFKERRSLENSIDDAIENINLNNDLPPHAHVPDLTYMVHALTARWSALEE